MQACGRCRTRSVRRRLPARSCGSGRPRLPPASIANFILAIAIFAVLFGDLWPIGRRSCRGRSASRTAPLRRRGVAPVTCLVAIDGAKVETFDDVRRYVSIRPEQQITVTIERAGEELMLPMVSDPHRDHRPVRQQDRNGPHRHRHQPGAANFRVSDLLAVWRRSARGRDQTGHIVTGTFNYIGNLCPGA